MLLKNKATTKQKKYLEMLKDGAEAIKRYQYEMKLINDDPRYSAEYKMSEKLKREVVLKDFFNANLDNTLAELEANMKGKVDYMERTEQEQMLDMAWFKEIMSVGTKELIEAVRKNIDNKVYLDMFELHRVNLEKSAVSDYATLKDLAMLKDEIDNLGIDEELAELASVLWSVKGTNLLWTGLDKLDEVEAEILRL